MSCIYVSSIIPVRIFLHYSYYLEYKFWWNSCNLL